MRRASDARTCAFVLAAWLIPLGFARAEVDAARVAELKARALAKKSTYQFELPSRKSAARAAEDGSRDPQPKEKGKSERNPPSPLSLADPPERIAEPETLPEPPPRSITDLLELLLWVAMIAGAGLGAVYLVVTYTDLPTFVIEFTRRRSAPTDRVEASEPRAPRRADPVGSTLEQADELAKRGEFGEALHVLLKVVLFELARRRDGGIPPSLTAREVVVSDVVPFGANAPLGRLVGSVELCLFGGRPGNPGVFADARELCSGILIQLRGSP